MAQFYFKKTKTQHSTVTQISKTTLNMTDILIEGFKSPLMGLIPPIHALILQREVVE